jgi:creatinine amidohydrolase
MQEVEWARLKAQDLRELANKDAVVILPIASIEQHGPHLPTMTDTRLGHEVAVRAAREAYDVRPTVVTPVVWSGLSEHHMAFGGTLTLSHETFRRVIADLVEAIARQGFRHIMISNSHGGNMIAMQQILDELSPDFDGVLIGATYVTEAGDELAQHLEDQPGIMHAGEGETSMMMVCEGDLVDTEHLGEIAQMHGNAGGFLRVGRAGYRWRPFAHKTANGLAGNPARATAEKGEKMLAAGASALARLIMDSETWADPMDRRDDTTGGVPFRR